MAKHNGIPLQIREHLIARCANDGFDIWLPEYPNRQRVAQVKDVELEAELGNKEIGARLWFVRSKRAIYEFTLRDLSSPSVWIVTDHERLPDCEQGRTRIAITYSDGGAIGGFHVRVFLLDCNGVKDVTKSIQGAVADFRARHYCKERGNNVTALKWTHGTLLLITEVYPTGDCAPETGHLEGYRVSIPDGRILEHLSLSDLKRYPGVCLQNEEE